MSLSTIVPSIKQMCRFFRRSVRNAFIILDYTFHKNVFVFGSPYHSNAGDQAQSYCIEKWFNDNYPNYKVHLFDTEFISANNYRQLKVIHRVAHKQDKIILHSGYHTTDLYMFEENMQREVVKTFSKHKIIVFPQTIYYQNKVEEQKAQEIYNNHPNLVVLCRDEVSYKLARNLFQNCRCYLFPDIVTTLIGAYQFNYPRKGILLCTRNDKEGFISDEMKRRLIDELRTIDYVDQTDTTLSDDPFEFSQNRKKTLEREWNKYAHYRLVITDRYHGTIFSLIANTPVIVIPSTDHKLESGVRWFPESYQDYVTYCSKFENVANKTKAILQKDLDYQLPEYFGSKYYSKLKAIIEDR